MAAQAGGGPGGGGPPHYGYGGRRLAAVPAAAAAEARQRPCTSTVHEDSLSPTFHACCSFGGVSSSGAQVRVQILDHDETLLSLAPDPVIGDARASLSADVSTQQVALTIRAPPLPGQAAGTVQLNSWFIADDPKDASLQAVAVVAAMPGGNSMQGVRATITPDFRSPEASAAGFVAHASAVEHAGLEDSYTVSVPAGSPYSRFIAVPRQDAPTSRSASRTRRRVVGVVTRRSRARIVGRAPLRRPRHRPFASTWRR